MKNLILIALLCFLTACSLVEDGLSPCPAESSEAVHLNFRLLAADQEASSRADNAGHEETDSELPALEDGIDLSDLDIFIFAHPAAMPAAESLVARYGASSSSVVLSRVAPGVYDLGIAIPRNAIDAIAAPDNSTPSPDTSLRFRVVILANSRHAADAIPASDSSISFSSLLTRLSTAAIAMSDIYDENASIADNDADNDDNEALALYGSKGSLPMYGSDTFTISRSALALSRPQTAVMMGELDMLRALAKIRLVDNIADKDADGYPRIAGAEILSSQAAALLLPYDAALYINGQQVHTPNIHLPSAPLLSADAVTYRMGRIPSSLSMTPASARNGDTFIAYLPEQKIDYADGNVSTGLPLFRISIALGKDASGREALRIYDVPMTAYNNSAFAFGDAILRNHIYTLTVGSVAPDVLTVKARLTPWLEERHHLSL